MRTYPGKILAVFFHAPDRGIGAAPAKSARIRLSQGWNSNNGRASAGEWKKARYKTGIYIGPSMSFHVNLGEGCLPGSESQWL